MTTIKSMFTTVWEIGPERPDGYVCIEQRPDDQGKYFNRLFRRADLLDALDAVPREHAMMVGPYADRAEKAEAKLAEAEATIERLKAWAVDYFGALHISEGFDDALTPPKRFELPTEPGVKFYGDHNGYQVEFTTYSNGSDALYVSDDGDIWTPLQMDTVTDLRGAE